MSKWLEPLRHYGLYRAVVADNRDPQNLRRLKLQVQTTGTEITNWAWPVLSTSIPPAIGSGVYVAYLGGDPEYPLWIGEFGTTGERKGLFAYGSWYSTSDQTAALTSEEYIMTVNNEDYAEDISLVDSQKFTVKYGGIYNLQFSAQFHHRTGGGGGTGTAVWVWLKKNGTSIPSSATRLNIPTGDYAVAAWNFFAQLDDGDYLELAWYVNTTDIALEYETSSSPAPAVPSLIVTMNQIS